MYYDNPGDFINGSADTKEMISRIDTVIRNLITCSINAASNSDVQNYSFNDGQSTISINYRTPSDLALAIKAFKEIRVSLINDCQGRVTILRDADVLARRRY